MGRSNRRKHLREYSPASLSLSPFSLVNSGTLLLVPVFFTPSFQPFEPLQERSIKTTTEIKWPHHLKLFATFRKRKSIKFPSCPWLFSLPRHKTKVTSIPHHKDTGGSQLREKLARLCHTRSFTLDGFQTDRQLRSAGNALPQCLSSWTQRRGCESARRQLCRTPSHNPRSLVGHPTWSDLQLHEESL